MSCVTRILIAGEYPPQHGGVADFTRLLSNGLARAGERVQVVAPVAAGAEPDDPGISVLRVPRLGFPSLGRVSREIERLPEPRRILVQYVPHAFGWRGMNYPFCAWLSGAGAPVDLLFHEVAFPSVAGQPIGHALLAAVQRAMARRALAAAERVFVSTEAWTPLLRRLGASREPTWVPIPSNLPTAVDRAAAERLRASIVPPGAQVIGHFGTFGEPIAAPLRQALLYLLAKGANRHAILVGRGSERFRDELARAAPGLAARIHAAGPSDPDSAALHLAAADILLQPYPDGATTRRTTLCAGLALGAPVVSNEGPLSEPLWRESGAVALASSAATLVVEAERLLSDERARRELGVRAAALYSSRLSLERLIHTLSDPEPPAKLRSGGANG